MSHGIKCDEDGGIVVVEGGERGEHVVAVAVGVVEVPLGVAQLAVALRRRGPQSAARTLARVRYNTNYTVLCERLGTGI